MKENAILLILVTFIFLWALSEIEEREGQQAFERIVHSFMDGHYGNRFTAEDGEALKEELLSDMANEMKADLEK